ncbi:MAG: hypothetical protein O8C61_06145 [Candidatus Methanoperedens sp.]|nr:hypothetical protein [Candidatus Methanoperedens sp.]
MKMIIRDENGTEEILVNDANYTGLGLYLIGLSVMWHIVILVVSGFNLKSQFPWLIMTLPLIFVGMAMIISDRKTVVIDKKLHNVITDNHLVSGFRKIEKVSLTDIKEVKITYDSDGENSWFCHTYLITTQGKAIQLKSSRILIQNLKMFSDFDKENEKKLGIKICELIGINGQHINTDGKSTPIIEAT